MSRKICYETDITILNLVVVLFLKPRYYLSLTKLWLLDSVNDIPKVVICDDVKCIILT